MSPPKKFLAEGFPPQGSVPGGSFAVSPLQNRSGKIW
jgi:hypothetical protein